MKKVYIVVECPYNFGYTVRIALMKNGRVAVPLPYRERDIIDMFDDREDAYEEVEKLTKEAQRKLRAQSFDLLRRDDEQHRSKG